MAQVSTDKIRRKISELLDGARDDFVAARTSSDGRDGGHAEYDRGRQKQYAAEVLRELLEDK